MSRQYFADVIQEPPTLNPLASAVVATVETQLWLPATFTPIASADIRAGKIYQCKAGGIYSTAATGALTITPRWGASATVATNITMGASGAQTVPASVSGVPWYLQFTMVVRTVGLAGLNSIVIGNGFFVGTGTVATAGTALSFAFGGTSATFDASAGATVPAGLAIGWTLSVAGSVTPEWLTWQSLN
jgi:hypothetical protein